LHVITAVNAGTIQAAGEDPVDAAAVEFAEAVNSALWPVSLPGSQLRVREFGAQDTVHFAFGRAVEIPCHDDGEFTRELPHRIEHYVSGT
jgi:hypothetical protein